MRNLVRHLLFDHLFRRYPQDGAQPGKKTRIMNWVHGAPPHAWTCPPPGNADLSLAGNALAATFVPTSALKLG